jgi:hypothetical protein
MTPLFTIIFGSEYITWGMFEGRYTVYAGALSPDWWPR